MEPRNRFQGMKSAILCSLAGRDDNPIPNRFLAPINCSKIPAQDGTQKDITNPRMNNGLMYVYENNKKECRERHQHKKEKTLVAGGTIWWEISWWEIGRWWAMRHSYMVRNVAPWLVGCLLWTCWPRHHSSTVARSRQESSANPLKKPDVKKIKSFYVSDILFKIM